jgi:hypothetical protein
MVVKEGITAESCFENSEQGVQDSEVEFCRLSNTLCLIQNMKVGHLVTASDMRTIRPSAEVSPRHCDPLVEKMLNEEFLVRFKISLAFFEK